MYLDLRKIGSETDIKLFNRVAFAVSAVSKDDLKPSLQNVLIEKNRIVGCDGHRLHITEGDIGDIKPGQYWPVKIAKTRLILLGVESPDRYPNIDNVFPDYSDWESIKLDYVLNKKHYEGLAPNYAKIIRAGELMRGFNHDLFAELLGGNQNFHTAIVDLNSAIRPIIFKGNDGALGLLMPVRVSDETVK